MKSFLTSIKKRSKLSAYFILTIILSLSLSGCELLYLSALAIDCGTRPDLKISPEKLKDATVDKKYLLTFSIANNHTPVGGYHIKSGKLPKGLELAHKKTEPWGNIGMIKGTPTEAGDFKIVIAAWAFGTQCAGQSGSREYILHVKDNKK